MCFAANAADPELADLQDILASLEDKVLRFPLAAGEGAEGNARNGDDEEDDGEDNAEVDASGAGLINDDEEDVAPLAEGGENAGAKRPPADGAADDNEGASKKAKPE